MNVLSAEKEARLILENMGLVISIAKKFKAPTQTEFDEYVQVGMIGLLKSIRSFDAEKAQLSTWAYKHIRWEIVRYINDQPHQHTLPLSSIDENKGASCLLDSDELQEQLPSTLTEEEFQAISLRCAGHTLAEIADAMDVNIYTIGKIFKSAIDKIRVANSDEEA
jgi:RNA polymerase sigma factor (sigma-70 family)